MTKESKAVGEELSNHQPHDADVDLVCRSGVDLEELKARPFREP
jgi:hypothetical protein